MPLSAFRDILHCLLLFVLPVRILSRVIFICYHLPYNACVIACTYQQYLASNYAFTDVSRHENSLSDDPVEKTLWNCNYQTAGSNFRLIAYHSYVAFSRFRIPNYSKYDSNLTLLPLPFRSEVDCKKN